MSMGKRRDLHKEQEWRRRLRDWQRSGLSVSAFCRRYGLAEKLPFGIDRFPVVGALPARPDSKDFPRPCQGVGILGGRRLPELGAAIGDAGGKPHENPVCE